ncbi:MAG: efflux RND transporter permease subunit [Candidatus Krumholzibacteria bacterium]|nr:efflux RND transporter permease subunit [Candidatus Krumholzibacteria bacterium]
MNPAKIALDKNIITWVVIALLLLGGIQSFMTMPRLEDPEFTIKDAIITTPYPGASAEEVEEEVTDRIEKAVQEMGQLKEIFESTSQRGMSTIKVRMHDKYDADALPQVWDVLRRKVGDVHGQLPPGAGPSMVNDDFGDVYGIFFAITGDGYSYAQLKQVGEFLRKELALVDGVSRVDFFGMQPEVMYIELDRDRMAQLGVPPAAIIEELQAHNLTANAGRAEIGPSLITISPTGIFESAEDFERLVLSSVSGTSQIHLGDVADVRRGYRDPPSMVLHFDGKEAIGLGISTVAGGNVVLMGEALKIHMAELQEQIPVGIEFGIIAMQPDAVIESINGFVISLGQAVLIVIVVLLLFMGLRSGLLIGFILLLTICGSFIFLKSQGVILERISLGALIIALGMLVDNAIVVVDGMLINMGKGEKPRDAAIEVVGKTAIPLLAGTMIAILAFAAVGTSQDKTGEYTRSLFSVILVSLTLSWVTAVTITPFLATRFLKVKPPKEGEADSDPYDTGFYNKYKAMLGGAIRFRWASMLVVLVIFGASVYGFGTIEGSFFPESSRDQFLVDYWLPQGTSIHTVEHDINEIEKHIMTLEGVDHVSATIGGGAIRFLLTYNPEKANSGYAQMQVEVEDYKQITRLKEEIQDWIESNYPESIPAVKRFINGPAELGAVQVKIIGDDPVELRRLSRETLAIYHADPDAFNIRTDWGEPVKVVRAIIAKEQANLNGITRTDVARTLLEGFEGVTVGVYREGIDLIPIIIRAPEPERLDINSIQNLQIWSPVAGKSIPLTQVVTGFETVWEDQIMTRTNRRRSITVLCDPEHGLSSNILARVRPQVEALEMPPGYSMEWWGENKSTLEAQTSLAGSMPVFILMMMVLVVALFNSLRQTLVIWLIVPLGIIGVTIGLLGTGLPFGFLALLGFLSLIGMIIKNSIVLIDEINIQVSGGAGVYTAILSSATSRLRPVSMAAATTVLGMAPLFPDPFFNSLAVTVAAGLTFATVLTMVVLPIIYAIVYNVKTDTNRSETPEESS